MAISALFTSNEKYAQFFGRYRLQPTNRRPATGQLGSFAQICPRLLAKFLQSLSAKSLSNCNIISILAENADPSGESDSPKANLPKYNRSNDRSRSFLGSVNSLGSGAGNNNNSPACVGLRERLLKRNTLEFALKNARASNAGTVCDIPLALFYCHTHTHTHVGAVPFELRLANRKEILSEPTAYVCGCMRKISARLTNRSSSRAMPTPWLEKQ